MKWKNVEREFEEIKILFGMKNADVRLVIPKDFKVISGFALGSYWGRVDKTKKIITVKRNRPIQQIRNTIAHELAHLLFPNKPHWWIETFSYKIISIKDDYGRIGRYAKRYGHSPRELPSKKRLIEMAKEAAERLNL